jgi:HD-like signal output (HDOD) protein
MRRVMVVELDEQVAEGMRRSLRTWAHSWELRFVRVGDEALTAAADIDALVCDAALPGVETLLGQFKERFPKVARTVLAAPELKSEVFARLQALSHQVIRKPFLPALLFDLVERTSLVIEAFESERLKVVVGQLGDLPALPATYSRLSAMSQDPDVSMDAVAAVVERDPAITAAVLRIINSAYFGLPRRVSSVRETVRYLGIVPLRSLVLTVEVFEGLAKGKRALLLQHEALLRAYAMRELLGRSALSEQAFVGGILADVGMLLLLARLPVDAQAIERRTEAGILPWIAQTERLGCTAATIGAQLLARWNLPAPLIEAIALNHVPPRGNPAANVTTALSLVSAVEWSMRAPQHLQREFRAQAEQQIVAFPSSSIASIARYFGGAVENAG